MTRSREPAKRSGAAKKRPAASDRDVSTRVARELAALRRPGVLKRNVETFRREVLRLYEEVGLSPALLGAARRQIEGGIDGANFHLEEYTPARARRVLDRLEAVLRQADGPARMLERLERLEGLSITDGLTELYNYRYFRIRLRQEMLRARRFFAPFSLLLLDIDYFKKVNDTYGHLVGDHFLRELSRVFVTNSREIDQVFRYGGEEFAIILPRTGTREAFVLAERLRRRVAGQVFSAEGIGISVTISAGISTYRGEPNWEESDLVQRADQALYLAKARGRNRTYSEPTAGEPPSAKTALTLEEKKDLLRKKPR